MTATAIYPRSALLGDGAAIWRAEPIPPATVGELIDFSSYTDWSIRIGYAGCPAIVEKTDEITGHADSPNVRFPHLAGEIDQLPAGTYDVTIIGHDPSGKPRIMVATLIILEIVG